MERIRLGVFGVGTRGRSLAKTFMLLNCDIVAICDFREDQLEKTAKAVGEDVAIYRSFDEFIEHDMDAVVLANYFHEHAPYAIRCFEKGLHVYSECISNGTMAEGVELVRAFEKSNSIYMLAENYPQMRHNLDIQRVCKSGTLGRIIYAEGEYNHPTDPLDVQFKKDFNYFTKHWRNFLPRTYYITHSLGPVMKASGATPKRVSALTVYEPITGDVPTASHSGDRVAIITTQNDDGSIFRVTGCAGFGAHHCSTRVCGTNGQIENLRGMEGSQMMLRYNGWQVPEGEQAMQTYLPQLNLADEELVKKSGHGGSDYLTAQIFVECLKKGEQPMHPFNVYAAVAMSSTAILGHRSMLAGGVPYDIPDFRNEEDCRKYENDRETPFYGTNGGEPTIPCCSKHDFEPTEKQVELFLEVIKD